MAIQILSLDIATSCGWAHTRGRKIISGTWKLETPHRERSLWRCLNRYKKDHSIPDKVTFEEPGRLHGHANKVLPPLVGVVRLWAHLHGCQVETIRPTSLKKFATGSGKAQKTDMVAALADKSNVSLDSEKAFDEADAVWVLIATQQGETTKAD